MFARRSKDFSEAGAKEKPLTLKDYERRLNRFKTLPGVQLREGEPRVVGEEKHVSFDIVNARGKSVGYLAVAIPFPAESGAAAFVQDINAERGKGYGKAAYKELIKLFSERGLRLKSANINGFSGPIWQWLVKKGVARIIHEPEKGQEAQLRDTKYETI